MSETGVTATPGVARPGPGQGPARSSLRIAVAEVLPEVATAALVGFALAAEVLLQLGLLRPWLLLPLGVAAAAVAAVLVTRAARATPSFAGSVAARRWTTAPLTLVLVMVGAFIVFHGVYSSQWVIATRDPGVYAIAGEWLRHVGSLPIPTHADVFGVGPTVVPQGFYPRGTVIDPQANHLLPALLAVGGWLGGSSGLLVTNVVLGGLALLAFAGLARYLAGPWWAVAAVALLGASMPMIAFSRSPYTEPLTMLFFVGGGSLLALAEQSGRRSMFALAGLALGAPAMVRIDGFMSLVVAAVAGGVVLAQGRRPDWGSYVALVAGAVLPAVLGVLDLTRFSRQYLVDLGSQPKALYTLVAASFVVAAALGLLWRPLNATRLPVASISSVLAWLVPVGVGVGFLVLWTRPMWMSAHGTPIPLIGGLQGLEGLAVDPARTYGEYSLRWLTWYYGIVVIAAGVLGLCILVGEQFRRPSPARAGLLATVLVASAKYLWNPAIVPDHIWAMRRFLPIVIPGVVLAAVVLLDRVAGWPRGRPWLAWLTAAVAVWCALTTALVNGPLIRVRERYPDLRQVQAICAAAGRDGAIAVLGTGGTAAWIPAIRAFCQVPTAGFATADQASLAARATAVGRAGRHLLAVELTDGATPEGLPPLPALSRVCETTWGLTLTHPPRDAARTSSVVNAALVGTDGSLTPAGPATGTGC